MMLKIYKAIEKLRGTEVDFNYTDVQTDVDEAVVACIEDSSKAYSKDAEELHALVKTASKGAYT